MVRIVDLIYGKYTVNVDEGDIVEISAFLIKNRIFAEIDPGGKIEISGRGYKALKEKYGERIGHVNSKYGVNKIGKMIKKKIVCVIFLLLSALLSLFSSAVVWDVRVSGNDKLTDKEIIGMLEESGLNPGNIWSKMDLGIIESTLLSDHSEIAWVNINRRGGVAYVEVVESSLFLNGHKNPNIIGNIVAEYDCVIEYIEVKNGRANVSVGDVVRKGDVLISGVVESESGTFLCAADGVVKGKCIEYVTGEAKKVEVKSVESSEKLVEVDINFFKFNINIFKNYRNKDNVCDIIVEKQPYERCSNYKERNKSNIKYNMLWIKRLFKKYNKSCISSAKLLSKIMCDLKEVV